MFKVTIYFDAKDVGQTMFAKVGTPNKQNYLKVYQEALKIHVADCLGLPPSKLPIIAGMYLGPRSSVTFEFVTQKALDAFKKKHGL